MKILDKKHGIVEAEIYVDSFSAVNSYIESAWTDVRTLTDEEMDELQERHSAAIQAYAWESGGTRNHN
jgi:hypothetical protein